jgi:putative transposase
MRALAQARATPKLAPQEIRTFFVTAVTWQRRPLFRAEPMACLFLDTLGRYRQQGRFVVHEFVLMPDHFHLLLTPAPDVSLEKALQLLKGGFSFRVARELGSRMEIWQEGFTEHRVKNAEDFKHHASYIRENPVRARLAENAVDYPYGSAANSVEVDPVPPGLKPGANHGAEVTGLKSGASTIKTEVAAFHE